MFTVELYARIRRAVMVEGLSRREAAKRFGVHRNTITKMLQFSVPPGRQRSPVACDQPVKPGSPIFVKRIISGDSLASEQPFDAIDVLNSLSQQVCAFT